MSVAKQCPIEREYEKNPSISPDDIRRLRQWLTTQPHLPGEHLTGSPINMSVAKQCPIEREYEKNPSISPDDIRRLRQWLTTQPHLPGEHLTDLDLLLTYHCCERSAEVSKQVLDLHYTLRTLFTSFFKDRCFDKKAEFVLENVLFCAVPTRTLHGDQAVYVTLLNDDARAFNFVEILRTFMMFFDLWQYQEGTWPGFVIMINLDNCTMGHLAKLEVMAIRQALYFLQECMLVKLKSVHFINAPSFMDKLMMLLKPFMKKTLLETIQIHQPGSQELYNYLPKTAFPKEFGGEYKDHDAIRGEVTKLLQANSQFLKDENKKRVTESKRPGKAKTVEELFGIQGSFKKLDID